MCVRVSVCEEREREKQMKLKGSGIYSRLYIITWGRNRGAEQRVKRTQHAKCRTVRFGSACVCNSAGKRWDGTAQSREAYNRVISVISLLCL